MSKTPIEIFTQLANLGTSDLTDDFTSSPHFTSIQANSETVAAAVKRQLAQKAQQIAEDAAEVIIQQMDLTDKMMEGCLRDLSNIRRQESAVVNHIHTLAVARVFATRTNNYLPLMYANQGQWEKVEIPSDAYKTILQEIKETRNKPKTESKPKTRTELAKDAAVTRSQRLAAGTRTRTPIRKNATAGF